MKKILIYDTEIVNAIPNKKEPLIEGINYCKGWTDYQGMGISVIGVYDYYEDRYRVFTKDNFKEFQELVENRDLIVGFNSFKFDNSLCEAAGIKIAHKKHYDILIEIARKVYPEKDKPYFKDCGLNNCCFANFNTEKSGHGALAPIQWQEKKYGTVIDYCLNDVTLTKKLFDLVLKNEFIKNPKDPSKTFILDIDDKGDY